MASEKPARTAFVPVGEDHCELANGMHRRVACVAPGAATRTPCNAGVWGLGPNQRLGARTPCNAGVWGLGPQAGMRSDRARAFRGQGAPIVERATRIELA